MTVLDVMNKIDDVEYVIETLESGKVYMHFDEDVTPDFSDTLMDILREQRDSLYATEVKLAD